MSEPLAVPATCPACASPLEAGARFCEVCGAQVGAAAAATSDIPARAASRAASVAGPDTADADRAPISAPTERRKPVVAPHVPRPCAQCGGEVGDDLYCLICGTKAPSERDHFRQTPSSWVAGVCDRGLRHPRNEDAMALFADQVPGSRAVLVVCDGVSSSTDSDRAAMAAVRATLEVLQPPLPQGLGVAESIEAAAVRVLTMSAAAANAAVIAHTDPASPGPASCTWATAVVEGGRVRYAGIGDSRVYLFPDEGEPVQLTVDDSMAQASIDAGAPRAEAEASPSSHTITRWLGLDAPDVVPTMGVVEAAGPGWVLVCSDGLWNYASEPAALQARVEAVGSTDPAVVALALVDWANSEGGHDNITAALARLGKNASDTDVRERHG